MAFISDKTQRRTYDAENGYELFYDYSQPTGMHKFHIDGPEGSFHFEAISYLEKLPENFEKNIRRKFDSNYLLWNVYQWDDHWKIIIKDALISFKFCHGAISANADVFIRFGASGEIFSA